MTTAARPTFDTARGRDSTATTLQISARDLPGHTKLKYRKPGQGGDADPLDDWQLKEQLLKDEKESLERAKRELFGDSYKDTVKKIQFTKTDDVIEANEAEKDEYLKKVQSRYEDSDFEKSEGEKSGSDGDSSDESDSEDETALLMKELEKIKKEREIERKKKEEEEKELELEANHDEIMSGNPLLSQDLSFAVKRRWDEDVVFKNQARDMQLKPPKRFINDMLRSDFHRKFMKRYIH